MSSSTVSLQNYRIPLEEILRATDNFSRDTWLGDGGYGVVYKGQLSDRWQSKTVAIKRVNENSNQHDDDFRNELHMLSYFHHENVNAFIGYCDEGDEMIIAYEFAVNRSLDYLLQDPDRMRFTHWSQRLKICIGAARGLNYLHSGLTDNKIVIHRNVKSANIVFDHNMDALICGFDLSILCSPDEISAHVDSAPLGTPFYMDPVYAETGSIKTEMDVYSFGVVLFEILSGMLSYDPRRIEDGEPQLMNMVRAYCDHGREKLVDPFIRDQIDRSSFKKITEVAYECVSLDSDRRPTMDVVIGKLEEALDSHMVE